MRITSLSGSRDNQPIDDADVLLTAELVFIPPRKPEDLLEVFLFNEWTVVGNVLRGRTGSMRITDITLGFRPFEGLVASDGADRPFKTTDPCFPSIAV
jgi:hypothetical protein